MDNENEMNDKKRLINDDAEIREFHIDRVNFGEDRDEEEEDDDDE